MIENSLWAWCLSSDDTPRLRKENSKLRKKLQENEYKLNQLTNACRKVQLLVPYSLDTLVTSEKQFPDVSYT